MNLLNKDELKTVKPKPFLLFESASSVGSPLQ